jgi:Na+/H+-translocating membrane pyrophosphatase
LWPVLLYLALGADTAGAYITGALSSVLAGFFGMTAATKANVRTAAAAKESGSGKALRVAFFGGASWACRCGAGHDRRGHLVLSWAPAPSPTSSS